MREGFGLSWRCLFVLFGAGFNKKGNSRHVKKRIHPLIAAE
jgi:hypothetical protein